METTHTKHQWWYEKKVLCWRNRLVKKSYGKYFLTKTTKWSIKYQYPMEIFKRICNGFQNSRNRRVLQMFDLFSKFAPETDERVELICKLHVHNWINKVFYNLLINREHYRLWVPKKNGPSFSRLIGVKTSSSQFNVQ